MNSATLWLIIKAVLAVLPLVVQMVQSGKIKKANEDELLKALSARLNERIEAAKKAKEGDLPDEALDTDNRDNA